MIKWIFCDLDGTLYRNGVSVKDSESISYIENRAVIFNIATGRIFKQGYKMVEDHISLNGYFVCENGSYIYNNKNEIIFKGMLKDEDVKRIISAFDNIEKDKEADAQMYFKYNGDTVILSESSAFTNYSKDYILDSNFINRNEFGNLIGNIGVACEVKDELLKIEKILKGTLKDEFDIYLSSENTINIVPNGVSKGNAIRYIMDIEGIDCDEVATIGDSPNDISMLNGFKYSFAMSSSHDDVKKSAGYIVDNVSDAIKIIEKINNESV